MEVWHTIQVLPRLGRSMRSIARELSISRNTVKRYWDNHDPPRYHRQPRGRRLDHYADHVQKMLAQKFIGTRIFHELRQLGYTGSLTSVYRYLAQLQQGQEQADRTTVRFETPPGQQMQYDWKEWLVPVGGKSVKVYFHQTILSFSRYKYVTFSLDLSSDTIIRVLIQVLGAFQGGGGSQLKGTHGEPS